MVYIQGIYYGIAIDTNFQRYHNPYVGIGKGGLWLPQ